MKITVNAPKDFNCDMEQWDATYGFLGEGDVRMIYIESRSTIEVIVAKFTEYTRIGRQTNYYISSPNFGIAIPGIPSLNESHWITEKLINYGMPTVDAITVAAVLRGNIGDI